MAELGIMPASALSAEVAGVGADRRLLVLSSLSGLLPDGLIRGATVAVTAGRAGATSMLLALLAGASQGGAWCAVIGMPALSWAAAADIGVDLERLAVVPQPGPDGAAVAATLLDGFDLVAFTSPGPLAAGVCSHLSARARTSKSVLLAYGSAWPGANLTVSVEASSWHGRRRLRAHQMQVVVSGRGGAGRPRRGEVWLPADQTPPAEVTAAAGGAVPRLRVVS
jgi:hypothetical protein